MPGELDARLIRAYLAELIEKGLSDSYINGHARAIRPLVRFLHSEGYTSKTITFYVLKGSGTKGM